MPRITRRSVQGDDRHGLTTPSADTFQWRGGSLVEATPDTTAFYSVLSAEACLVGYPCRCRGVVPSSVFG